MAGKMPPKAPFVDKVVDDAATPPRIRMLTGYVGTSSEKDCLRLYSDPELTSYIEIPTAAIKHSEPVEGDSLGAVHLWVDRNAEIISRGENFAERRGRFLEGSIAQQEASAAAARPNPISQIDVCGTNLVGCGGFSQPFICETPRTFNVSDCVISNFNCVTRPAVCASLDCPTLDCPTLPNTGCVNTIAGPCQSQFIGCQQSTFQTGCQQVTLPAACQVQTRVVNCQSLVDACPSQVDNCVTQAIACQSEFQLCNGVTRNIQECFSVVDNCPTQRAPQCGGTAPFTRIATGCAGPSVVDGCQSALGCSDVACRNPGFGNVVDPGRFNMRPRFRGF